MIAFLLLYYLSYHKKKEGINMIKIKKSEEVLLAKLSGQIVKKYTVVEFCKEAKIERSYFYTRYENICDLFASVMTLQLRRELRGEENEKLNSIFFRMLEKIKNDKYFFLNIILISKDSGTYFEILQKEMATAIENYMCPRGAFSVRQVNLVASGIYAIIYNWILHRCKYDIRDVYQCINLLLKNIDRTETDSKD